MQPQRGIMWRERDAVFPSLGGRSRRRCSTSAPEQRAYAGRVVPNTSTMTRQAVHKTSPVAGIGLIWLPSSGGGPRSFITSIQGRCTRSPSAGLAIRTRHRLRRWRSEKGSKNKTPKNEMTCKTKVSFTPSFHHAEKLGRDHQTRIHRPYWAGVENVSACQKGSKWEHIGGDKAS